MDENVFAKALEGTPYFELVGRLGDLYVSYRQRYVKMLPGQDPFVPKRGGSFDQLSNRHLMDHLNQKYSVCVYAGRRSSKFICFDVDDGSRDTVGAIISTLTEIGFERRNIYVSTSGGKGYHVEMFFDGLMYTDKLRRLYDYVCEKNKLNKHKVEFRPTAGQSIKLPLGIHRKTGNICWFVDENFEPIESQEYLMSIVRIDPAMAAGLIDGLHYSAAAVYDDVSEKVQEREEPDLICGNSYPDIRREGERHTLMIQIAVHNRYRGLAPKTCIEELRHWYGRQDKSLIKADERAVLKDIDDIVAWAYGEKFQRLGKVSTVIFTVEDLRILAAQGAQTRRKVMFYVLLCMKRYGHVTVSAQGLAAAVGASRQGVIKALNHLLKFGWIRARRNRCVTKPEGIIRLPNTYYLSDEAAGWAKGYHLAYMEDLTKERHWWAQSIRAGDDIMLDPDFKMEPEQIQAAYAKVMITGFGLTGLRNLMTKKEFEDMEEYFYGSI